MKTRTATRSIPDIVEEVVESVSVTDSAANPGSDTPVDFVEVYGDIDNTETIEMLIGASGTPVIPVKAGSHCGRTFLCSNLNLVRLVSASGGQAATLVGIRVSGSDALS